MTAWAFVSDRGLNLITYAESLALKSKWVWGVLELYIIDVLHRGLDDSYISKSH